MVALVSPLDEGYQQGAERFGGVLVALQPGAGLLVCEGNAPDREVLRVAEYADPLHLIDHHVVKTNPILVRLGQPAFGSGYR